MKQQKFSTTCDDGVVLHGLLFIPEAPKAVLQFNCGTATNKNLYRKFLSYLAEHGYLCCLWDYRDSGDSAPPSLKGCNYQYADYGVQDIPAIKRYLRAQYPQLPLLMAGHSTGGQQLGMLEDCGDVVGAVLFAVSAGYYPNMPLAYRLKAYFFFYVFAPLSIFFCGYVAAKRFGFMEDLPAGVVRQWRSWLETPDYFFDEKFFGTEVPRTTYQGTPFPIKLYYSPDDTISNQKNTENFWRHTSSAKLEICELDLGKLPVTKVDHFGYFREALKDGLWADALNTLDGMLSTGKQSR